MLGRGATARPERGRGLLLRAVRMATRRLRRLRRRATPRPRGRRHRGAAGAAGGPTASWITHVRVDDAAAAAARVSGGRRRRVRDAFDAEPAGRLAVVADRGGALLCLWEATGREGAELVNEPGAWAMSALQTPHPAAAIAFYGAVFGWEPEAFGPLTLLRLPGYVGGEPGQPVPRDVVAVLVPDERRARALGRRLLGRRCRRDGTARVRARGQHRRRASRCAGLPQGDPRRTDAARRSRSASSRRT